MSMVQVLTDLSQVRHFVNAAKVQGVRVAYVPTMGYLHEGHLSLIKEALKQKRRVIASIFVNPLQFGPNEDFVSYPRDQEGDIAKLKDAGVDAVYLPQAEQMYPPEFATTVTVKGLTDRLEGTHRPGHFDGVATVVAKLLLQVAPDIAFFGEKDYQQLLLIKRLVADLSIPTTVVGVPTVREPSGLAKSSRNSYLNVSEKETAANLFRVLQNAASSVMMGDEIAGIIETAKAELLTAGFSNVDYVAVCDSQTLEHAQKLGDRPLRILAAAYIGKTRLIDNVIV